MKRGERNGKSDGEKSIGLVKNKNGVINGQKRLVLGSGRGKVGDKIIRKIIR